MAQIRQILAGFQEEYSGQNLADPPPPGVIALVSNGMVVNGTLMGSYVADQPVQARC